MSSLAEFLRYQIAYTAWADRRVMSAVKQLAPDELDHDFKTSEKSIRCTLAHIYRAERMWLSRITGPLLEFRVEGDDDVTALFANWPGISEKWINWSRTITDQGAAAEITYQDLRKNTWTHPLWKIILQVVNHSTHHRGQAIGFIRALDHTPPNVDSITFAREHE
jgi:uncharacterized damage-inducible protein DinB